MSRIISKQELAEIERLVSAHPDGISRAALEAMYRAENGAEIHPRTLRRRLARLIELGRIHPIGEGPAIVYVPGPAREAPPLP